MGKEAENVVCKSEGGVPRQHPPRLLDEDDAEKHTPTRRYPQDDITEKMCGCFVGLQKRI